MEGTFGCCLVQSPGQNRTVFTGADKVVQSNIMRVLESLELQQGFDRGDICVILQWRGTVVTAFDLSGVTCQEKEHSSKIGRGGKKECRETTSLSEHLEKLKVKGCLLICVRACTDIRIRTGQKLWD